jgi:hypothetical protein
MTKTTKKCFLISPIGEKGSDTRKHADAVRQTIVRPALKECGITDVKRADEITEPGKITQHMIQAIVGWDLCIAILTERNPNVFYEVAIAQAARRPLVFLNLEGQEVPFDLKDYRHVAYTLDPVDIFQRRWVDELAEHIKAVLRPSYNPPPLMPSLLRSSSPAQYWISGRSKEFGSTPAYEQLVEDESQFVNLCGISLNSWGRKTSYEVLRKLAVNGVRIRILTMDSEHTALPYLINENLGGQDVKAARLHATKLRDTYASFAAEFDSVEARTISKGLPLCQLLITSKLALVLQYLWSREGGESPQMQYPSGSDLYKVWLDEFDSLWQANPKGGN